MLYVKKTIIIKSKSEHNNSKTHKHKKTHGTVVEEYEFVKAEIDEVKHILNDTLKVCRDEFFY